MNQEIWNISSTISGNFILVKNEHIKSHSPPHQSLKSVKLSPVFDDHQKQTGKFELEIQFEISFSGERSDSKVPADLGRKLFSHFIDLLTFLSGYPVTILKGPSLIYHYPDSKTHRLLAFSTEQVVFGPMTPILNTDLISSFELKSIPKRVVSWFRKGLQESDIANSIFAFCVSIEILANQYDCPEKINRECQNCGHVSILDAGMRQKIEYLIVDVTGFTTKDFNHVWKVRNSLLHGGYDSNSFETPELSVVRSILIGSLVKGIKKLLNLSSMELPPEDPKMFPFFDPILDVTYKDK